MGGPVLPVLPDPVVDVVRHFGGVPQVAGGPLQEVPVLRDPTVYAVRHLDDVPHVVDGQPVGTVAGPPGRHVVIVEDGLVLQVVQVLRVFAGDVVEPPDDVLHVDGTFEGVLGL